MSRQIITQIDSRHDFLGLLKVNPGCIVLKFGATWCGPCKKIAPLVEELFSRMPTNVLCGEIDVDESFDVFAYLKSKKVTNGGIPVILCYYKGNTSFAPDDSVIGADPQEIQLLFDRIEKNCLKQFG